MSSMRARVLFFAVAIISGLTQLVHGHSESGAGAVLHRIDGKAVDQGIAYVLMLVALVITYFVH